MLFTKRFFALMVLCATGPAFAQAPIETTAEYAVIMDYRTGEVLFDKNGRVQTAPASMSKLMTVAIVFERLNNGSLNLTDEFNVSEKAWRMQGSKMWVRVDTQIPLIDLLRGVIVQSGNDACIVIAENLAGSEEAFADLMTQKAREWGMVDSTFANATGWPHPDHKMSMRDLASLTRRIINEYGAYYALFAEREFTWENIPQNNRNPLLESFNGADGLKTGHTDESGYGLVGSAVRDDERRIIVVNGLSSKKERISETTRLMRIAFDDFATKEFFQPGDIVAEAEVFKGKADSVPLLTKESVDLIMHRLSLDEATATVVYEGPIAAPIREDQQIGYLKVAIEGGPSREYPLYAGRAVSEMSLFGKIGLAAKTLLAKPPSENSATSAAQ